MAPSMLSFFIVLAFLVIVHRVEVLTVVPAGRERLPCL